jgi:hypothetical protein
MTVVRLLYDLHVWFAIDTKQIRSFAFLQQIAYLKILVLYELLEQAVSRASPSEARPQRQIHKQQGRLRAPDQSLHYSDSIRWQRSSGKEISAPKPCGLFLHPDAVTRQNTDRAPSCSTRRLAHPSSASTPVRRRSHDSMLAVSRRRRAAFLSESARKRRCAISSSAGRSNVST